MQFGNLFPNTIKLTCKRIGFLQYNLPIKNRKMLRRMDNSRKPLINLIQILSLIFLILLNFQCTNEEGNNQPPPEKIIPITPKPEYTEKEAGEWEEIKDEHLPKVKIDFKQDLAGKSLEVNQKPEVVLSLNPIPENPKVKVYVKCNLHDLWTKPLLRSKEN